MTGYFIAFEGGEGCGKSTQARLLTEALKAREITTILTREPGGTPGAEGIRQLLLDPPGDGWGARAEALLFAAARADHVEKLIRPALAKGQWVVSDRFVDSSRAYQGGAGGLGDGFITTLHEHGSEGLRPDLTILIEVSEETAIRRLNARDGDNSDAIGGRSRDYHASVAKAFASLAEDPSQNIIRINGDAPPQDVHRDVMQTIAAQIGFS